MIVQLVAGLVLTLLGAEDVIHDIAANGPHGVLAFRIVDDATGEAMPGRLTFVGPSGTIENLFTKPGAAPHELAVRRNVVYTLSGVGQITVPAGAYTVLASHGLEWSVDGATLEVVADASLAWTARLEHEVDTRGWVSGDFHLHTLTHSGHGDSNMEERIISIVGEGIEFAVATDHNHNTDYHPTIRTLDAGAHLTAVTGNEVSVPVGHFNAFPLDPNRPPVDAGIRDANELFRLLRAETNAFGVLPVIQVNHPRWDGIDYFRIAELDPVTGRSDAENYSAAFDTIELLNENTAWGYYEPHVDDVDTSGNLHSVVQDWYNLLNLGHRTTAVGNSDSHTVHYALAGYPRNFVASETDDAARIDVADIAARLRTGQVFTTVGPFVEWSVNGMRMGGETTATGGRLVLDVRVQAASWVDCDRVKVVVDGDIVDTITVPPGRDPLRLETRRTIEVAHDGWVALLVEGDDPMAPIVDGGGRPVRPLAVTNPVWFDVDGDGQIASVWDQVSSLAAQGPDVVRAALADAGPTRRGLAVLAAAETGRPWAADLTEEALLAPSRRERLLAARAARSLATPRLAAPVTTALANAADDPQLEVALLQALAATDRSAFQAAVRARLRDMDDTDDARALLELGDALPGRFVDAWSVVGYFDAPVAGTVLTTTYGPEEDSAPDRPFDGKGKARVTWTPRSPDSTGRLDLRDLASTAAIQDNAIAYAQTWLHVDEARDVLVTLGTDDGCRVRVNERVVYDNPARRAANPMEHVAVWKLDEGWNRVLFAVENGVGGFAAYLRVMDDGVRWTNAAAVGGGGRGRECC